MGIQTQVMRLTGRLCRDRLVVELQPSDLSLGHAICCRAGMAQHKTSSATSSGFFRDAGAFERTAVAVKDSLQGLPRGGEFRAWVPRCATGEEAYSIAIVVRECLEELGLKNPVKVFATDIHHDALRHAGRGIYPTPSMDEISAERRERFFIENDDGELKISPRIRSMLLFAPHDVLRDMPFHRLHLVACRNVLADLDREAQRRVLTAFHFALKPHGLLLGASESLDELGDAFEVVHRPSNLFRKTEDSSLPRAVTSSMHRAGTSLPSTVAESVARTSRIDVYRGVLDAVMPAALLVDERHRLVETFGGANRYLRVPRGRATIAVVEMLEGDLRGAVAAALERASYESGSVCFRDLRTDDAGNTLVDMTVRKVQRAPSLDSYFLVTIDEQRAATAEMALASMSDDDFTTDRIAGLETELRIARESLQITIEALETSNEELQTTNEELMASNEELQATNEEVQAVNEELREKIDELTQLTTDMDLLLVSSDIHTLFLDRDLRIRRFTPRIAKLFNLVPSDLGRRIDDFNHRLSRASLYEDVAGVLASGAIFEEQVQDAAGGWFLARILPYRHDGAIEGVVLTLIDITAMKRFEAEAQSKSELLSNILMNSPHPVYVCDREGRYIVADESFRQLAGRDPTGLKPDQIFSIDVAAMLTRDDARIARDGETLETEETIPTPSGPRTYLAVRFPMRDKDGAIIGIGGINTDVTSLKRAENEAREASNRRDRFLATLSHELRNPLAAIVNAARVVTRGTPTETDLARWHRIILERSLHTTRLVDDLLDVARLTQDKLALELAPVDLTATAKGVGDEVAALFQERGIRLVTELDASLPLMGDATRLHQLQVNLLTNAARHTPRGGVTTFQVRRSGDFAEVIVADSGEGIRPEMLDRIFDLFVQVDAPGARGAERGLGVGLALVRRIAELHGGDVSVASKGPGSGAEFRVRLPLEVIRPVVDSGSPVREEAGEKRPRSVVLVDDDLASCAAMSKLLELDDVSVRAAHRGEQALALLMEGPPPDLVLLDLGLPGMDGYEVCRRIRALPKGERLLVFALTGFGQDSDREKTKQGGFDGHLTKPVDVEDVFALYEQTQTSRRPPPESAK